MLATPNRLKYAIPPKSGIYIYFSSINIGCRHPEYNRSRLSAACDPIKSTISCACRVKQVSSTTPGWSQAPIWYSLPRPVVSLWKYQNIPLYFTVRKYLNIYIAWGLPARWHGLPGAKKALEGTGEMRIIQIIDLWINLHNRNKKIFTSFTPLNSLILALIDYISPLYLDYHIS